MPEEVLTEKLPKDEKGVVCDEMAVGKENYWAHTREKKPENIDPNAGDSVNEAFVAIEHNGGTVLIDMMKHLETDASQERAILDALGDFLTEFELVNHKPQTEYEYVIGKYTLERKEELEGKEVKIEETVVMNEDHTCEITFQDTVKGDWTATTISISGGVEYGYTVEGDNLYLNVDGEWREFARAK